MVIELSQLAKNEFLPEYVDNGKQNKERPPFAIDKPERERQEVIKVVAVGGGGGNAINHIIGRGVEGVELLAVNTDIRSLDMSLCKDKFILGEKSTKGLGAGAIPEVGEMAARESLAEVRSFLKGSDMVYFTAGMGGGTGTGALPVIANAAKEMGILTVAVVTKPFSFEGARKRNYAEIGIRKLRDSVDALIVVPNDRLLEISKKETPLSESFSLADEVLRLAVLGVTNLITRSGMVNVDFADLKAVMKEAGRAVMGIGIAEGDDRMAKAMSQAVGSPLMECSMQGAKGALMNITCGSDLGIHEISEAASCVETLLAEDATFIWGYAEDPELEGKVEIVIIATGFEDHAVPETEQFSKTNAQPLYRKQNYPPQKREKLEQFVKTQTARAQGDTAQIDGHHILLEEQQEAARQAYGIKTEPEESLANELVSYVTTSEKPRLISEMTEASSSRWAADKQKIQIKAGTDEFDAPTFTRQGKGLKEQQ